jgi:hypothetical protein
MARLIDEIQLAWKSIQTSQGTSGWNTVAVLPRHPGRFRAGRNFPDQCEALLAGFRTSVISRSEKLPEGLGFHVTRLNSEQDGLVWLALTRSPNGNLELFSAMVSDVLNAILATGKGSGDHSLELRAFLGRIRAWQEFMRKGNLPLSAENEVGLVGELTVLEKMLEVGMVPEAAIRAWSGPFDGLRDFELGFGAIEVKTTVATAGLVAKIGSLEQLDDTNCKPIFLGAVKYALTESGQTLPEKISAIRIRLESDPIRLSEFNDRVLAAGYLPAHSHQYHRRFSLRDIAILEIGENFPRLMYGNVTPGVISARYEINLEPLLSQDVGLTTALKKLEMI